MIGKIKQNDLDCLDTADFTMLYVVWPSFHAPVVIIVSRFIVGY